MLALLGVTAGISCVLLPLTFTNISDRFSERALPNLQNFEGCVCGGSFCLVETLAISLVTALSNS